MSKRIFVVVVILVSVFSIWASGAFAYSHYDGLSAQISSGFSYDIMNLKGDKTKISETSVPVNFQITYLFPSKERVGLTFGTQVRFPLKYYSTQSKTSYSFTDFNFLISPYLFLTFNWENYNNRFAVTWGFGARYENAKYLYYNEKHLFSSIELDAFLYLRFALDSAERYRLCVGLRGGYSPVVFFDNAFTGFFKGSSMSITPLIGISYEF